jgi:hypothetical protein
MSHRVIGTQNQASLVEWRDSQGILRRSTIPANMAMSELSEDELAAGIPFGLEWDELIDERLKRQLANRLHDAGFWEYRDAANHIREFRALVNATVVASLLDAARGVKV